MKRGMYGWGLWLPNKNNFDLNHMIIIIINMSAHHHSHSVVQLSVTGNRVRVSRTTQEHAGMQLIMPVDLRSDHTVRIS